MNLVIVESPAKSKTLKKFLGPDFEILASYGHVRDLVPKSGAVDTENGFAMKYEIVKKSKAQVDKIVSAIKKADTLYLATDPDREGEAIAWHLHEILKQKKLLDNKNVYRVAFYEITAKAVREAVAKPRELSGNLVNAQQARRALDYLVGFNLSPLLWKKIKGGLSAGRVQSPALRMIVERETEIKAFTPREYWTITTQLEKDKIVFPARLYAIGGEKVKQFDISDEQHAHRVRDEIQQQVKKELLLAKVEKKQRKRNPAPPFTTSTLQQEASRKLGFSASRTMRVAQQLYEGINLGGDSVGLITYMRTDSLTLANDAIQETRTHIGAVYGQERVPSAPRLYKTKSKNAQEAHEAIRPTATTRTPAEIKSFLESDQFRLYDLIWKRTVACQMISAILDTVSADFTCGDYTLRATGSTVKEPGFMLVYTESQDNGTMTEALPSKDQDDNVKLPEFKEKDHATLNSVEAQQHFTEPPPRYSEASLIKTLEEHGIGRPSTYASIISTLQTRDYAELLKKRFHPTETGTVVIRFLTEHFTRYVDYSFTANLEDELDEISRGERNWVPVMEAFWEPFKSLVDDKEQNVQRSDVLPVRELGTDPKTQKPITVKLGRYGPYVQIGTREDEEKPQFAGLRPGQKMDTITFEEAMKLFELPRDLGITSDEEPVQANIGRFGPFVKYGDKYASLREDDPHTITLERALEVIAAKKKADAEKIIKVFEEEGIQVLKGRWGPFITDGDRNARIPKEDIDRAASLTLEECQKLLEKAPVKKKAGKKKTVKKKTVKKSASANKQTK